MVYLSRIYTKTGDTGETALGDGSRVPKDHARVAAYGSVDETNAALAVLRTLVPPPPEAALIQQIQNDLFDLGADLCVPQLPDDKPDAKLRVHASQITRLEQAIDRLNEPLPPLTSFVVPGTTACEAWCHMARTICRRAERDVYTLSRLESLNSNILIYLNRLSDLLFILARVAQDQKGGEPLWQPGKGQGA